MIIDQSNMMLLVVTARHAKTTGYCENWTRPLWNGKGKWRHTIELFTL